MVVNSKQTQNLGQFGNLGIFAIYIVVGIGIGIVIFFCLPKPYFLIFEVSCEVKHLWLSPFQIHLQAFLGVFTAA